VSKKAAFITLTVLALSWLAAEMLVPRCILSPRHARERVLQQDLFTIHQILSQYTRDNHRRPQSLDELVAAGYLKQVPVDPTTGRNDTWVLEHSDDPKTPGITAIRSALDPSRR
jgi:general secretion pathway protein G